MGNTFRSFIDKLPEVIDVEEPELVDTSIVDKFDEAIARANANATTGVMNEVIQAGEDSENEVSAMLANIINQTCDGDQVCTNMETMFGDGNGCAAGNPVCGTLGSIVWKEQCENKVNRGKPVHLEDHEEDENYKQQCEGTGRYTMCEWNAPQTLDSNGNVYREGVCKMREDCSVVTDLYAGQQGKPCGLQGDTQIFVNKGLVRTCFGVDSETTRGCKGGDINDPLAPTVENNCMVFATKEEGGEDCDPIAGNEAMMRQCKAFVSARKPLVAWNGIDAQRDELERLDTLYFAAQVYSSGQECRDRSGGECLDDPNCELVGGDTCVPKSQDLTNECTRFRSVSECGGAFCKWDGEMCIPDKGLVGQARNTKKTDVEIMMSRNIEEYCEDKMCVKKSSGYKHVCVPYFDDNGRINDCPSGFAERPEDIHGRRHPAPECQHNSCKDDIVQSMKPELPHLFDNNDNFKNDELNRLFIMEKAGINRGISERQCIDKGCDWMPLSVAEPQRNNIKCFEKGKDEPCNYCLIRNIDQTNVRISERNSLRKEEVDNRIQDVDLVMVQQALRDVASKATGGFDMAKVDKVQNLADACMNAATDIETKVRQDCLQPEDSSDGNLLLNAINQTCSDVDAGCVISDITQTNEMKGVDSCLQQVKIANDTTQKMKQILSQLGITATESFQSQAIKTAVWSAVVLGAISSILLWATVDVYMAIIPIVLATIVVFMAGSKLYAPEHTDESMNTDRILAYASVRRSKAEEPFGCGVEPFTSMDNLTVREAVNFCRSQRCKSFYWESNGHEQKNQTKEATCPSICTDSDAGLCEQCCPAGYKKVVERQGRYKKMHCERCMEKKGTAHLYDEDISVTHPGCVEGFHQPDQISKGDLRCLSRVDTWAGFAKPATSDVALQGKALAKKAILYGSASAVALIVLDMVIKMMKKTPPKKNIMGEATMMAS